MEKFLDHRVQVIRRRTEYLLREAKRRGHVLEGQLIAIAASTRSSRSAARRRTAPRPSSGLQDMEVPASLMERAHRRGRPSRRCERELGARPSTSMTEQQAEAVVRLQLGQLAALERDEILKEYTQLREQIRGYETLLSDEANILAVIRADLEQMRDEVRRRPQDRDHRRRRRRRHRRPDRGRAERRHVSHKGFIKRLPLTEYRVQGRGGKGVQGGLARERLHRALLRRLDEGVPALLHQHRADVLAQGVRDPEASRTSPGRAIANVLSLKPEEKITSIVPVREFTPRASTCSWRRARAW